MAGIRTKLAFDSGYTYILNLGSNNRITEHFTFAEEANTSAKETVKLELTPEALIHARMREEFRMWWGRAIPCNSCYRTESFNQQVGGIKNSLHLYATASDLQMGRLTDAMWNKVVDKWRTLCDKYGTVGEIGRYDWGVHIGSHIECTPKPYTYTFYIFDKRTKK